MKMGAVLSIFLFSVSVVQAQEVWPYHESFETGYGRWSTPATSYSQWYRQYGSSAWYYWNTGPSGAHDRNYYCYVSSSSSSILQNVEMIATFDLTALANPFLTFRYHMHGGDMGAMKVEANDGSGWEEIALLIGEKQGEYISPWGKAETPLTDYKSAATQIRFTGTTGTGYSSDICIDDIWIYDLQVLPASFEWTAIDDRQTNGVSFPVQVTALNSTGNPLTSFGGPVELTAWSDGFGDACQNGDFESWPTDLWTPYTNAVSSGDAIIVGSLYGSGYAVAFNPDAEDDGLSQVINVSGGELYYVSAKYTFRNAGDSHVTGNFSAKILVDGVAVANSYDINTLYTWNTYSYQFGGSFYVPESEQEGTRTISIVAASGNPVDDDIWVSFDDVSVNFAPEQYIDVSSGTSGEFTNGVWNGTVAMDYRLPNIHLIARYGDVIGHSGIFTTYVSAYDMDYDGMVDNWERLYFSSTEACDAEADPDKDGYSNVDEFIIGTNPTLGDSHLAFRTRVSGEKCIMDWYANETCTYDVEWTPNLKYTDFTMIAEDVPYTQASFTNDLSNVGFYRINVHKK